MAKPSNKRSLTIARHRTSISLEDGFWTALHEFAEADGRSVADVVSEIDQGREKDDAPSSLSAAIRLYILERMQARRKTP
ncbi:MAG: ribbon-helix-helix domain-containing protein [Methyloceanibacter sp.]|uniref:ribbon-helix-helix domain-containing protein n=1 Tax=Methyloceanibacter sp. TaxID=1965321 RepID=UPI003D9AD208